MFKHLVCLSMIFIFTEGTNRWHTSQIALNKLFDLQQEHINVFKNYLNLETKRLDELKKNLASINKWRDSTINNRDIYLHNHINGLNVMSSIQQQLYKIEYLMNNQQSVEIIYTIDKDNVLNEDDIISAYRGIKRIQVFYEMSSSDMTAGTYNGQNIGDEIDACECFVMLKYYFEENYIYKAIEWTKETYNKWINNGRPNCLDITQLYLYALSLTMSTGYRFSFLINPASTNNNELKNIDQYFFNMKNEILESTSTDVYNRYNTYEINTMYGIANTKNLCKTRISTQTLTVDSKCQYNSKNSLYYMLMPFKEEHISNDPYLKIYHDVLYDNEIMTIKSIAMENMVDAKVRYQGIYVLDDSFRSSQFMWIPYEMEAGNFDSLNIRIESFTGLSTISAEKYQVCNYGLSGHFMSHYDGLDVNTFTDFDKKYGNRLATVLFYLNDVKDDGYTLFPTLNLVFPPEKGAAIVWYNLHISNGSVHDDTLHTSCPIIKGNKWIMTRWLHEYGQDLEYKRNTAI